MTESENPRPRGMRCEVHGLLYDPNRSDGCVLCRREAGQPTPAAPGRVPPDDSMKKALAVAAGLILVTSLGLFAAHRAVVKMVAAVWSGDSSEGGLSIEEISNAGLDPRLQEALDAIKELEEIEAKRYGATEDTEYYDDAAEHDVGY